MLYSDTDYLRVKTETEESVLGRSPFRRDYARLLHSPSFRRLQGKTQLFPGHESDFFRNRLTHSLEVAQIAKGLAQQINAQDPKFRDDEIDVDLVEFAGLAHDLGHPPFGHNGERALNDCMRRYGGFEGNAQTLHILCRVEKKVQRDESPEDNCGIAANGVDRRLGLNLTYRSLAAILKYDEMILENPPESTFTKGYFESEKELVEEIKANVGSPKTGVKYKTIECQIMDIADDIAYSTYDLEDAMKGGFTHPMQLLARVQGDDALFKKLFAKVSAEVPDLKEEELYTAVNEALELDVDQSEPLMLYTESKMIAADAKMRCEFSSQLVGAFMGGVSVVSPFGEDSRFFQVEVRREIKIKIEALKHLNYLLTIMSTRLKVVEYRGYDVVKSLFDMLSEDDGNLLLPEDLQKMYERLATPVAKKRLICDFIAGMTDRYAVELYSRLRESGLTIFKPI